MSDEKIGLSRMWTRAAAPTPRTTFTCSGVAVMSGRLLSAWPYREVALRRVGSGAALGAMAERVRAAEGLHTSRPGPTEGRLPCGSLDRGYDTMSSLGAGPSHREATGLSERLVAALTATDRGADLLGFMVLTRRLLGERVSLTSGQAVFVDLEVDIDWLHLLPAMRGLGYGHAMGMAAATTILADVRRLVSDMGHAPLPVSVCVSVAGASRSAAADTIVRGAVASARLGLETLEINSGSSVVDIGLSDREFIYLVPAPVAEASNDLLESETPRR